MAAASMFPGPSDSSVPRGMSLPQQKRVLQDVLDCVVQLKSDFFENHQPITDDSLDLQRLCAKFEHLLQMGMKEKTSLLGRRKDYWDYFCECLGTAKGTNDGIKYVKSLGENKTSLGRGRAFIRFCLVHQRLADTVQQCAVHEKTRDWFLPNSILTDPKESSSLISSLYDLNSMHFDLSPRGYDLDSSWPSFANRKHSGSGSWNVPISRRSSITSMDTVSQLSVSVQDTATVDRLTRDLETAQNATGDLVGQLETLHKEKEKASQSAWATQGELQAVQALLSQLQSQHAQLQERYKDLDVSHMKLKMEKDHLEKLRADETKAMKEKFEEEEWKRVTQLNEEEQIWKQEVKEESERKNREIEKLRRDLEMKAEEVLQEKNQLDDFKNTLQLVEKDFNLKPDGEDVLSSLNCMKTFLYDLQGQLHQATGEKNLMQEQLRGDEAERAKQLSHQEGRLLELEKALKEAQDSRVTVTADLVASELELKREREKSDVVFQKVAHLEQVGVQVQAELDRVRTEKVEVEDQLKSLEVALEGAKKEMDMLKDGSEMVRSEMQTEMDEKEKSIAKLKAEIDSQEKAISERMVHEEKAKDDFQREVMEKDMAFQNLQREIEEKDLSIQGLRKELEDLKSSFEVLSKEAEEAGAGALVLTEKLSQAESKAVAMNTKYNDLDEKAMALEAEIDQVNSDLKEKNAWLKEIETERDILSEELSTVKADTESLNSQLENVNARLKSVEAEKEALTTQVLALQADKENLRRDMDTEKDRMVKLLRDADGVKQSEGEKSEKIASLVLEVEELRRDRDREVAELQGQLEEVKRELVQKGDSLTGSLSKLEELQAKVESEVSCKENLQKSHASELESLKRDFTIIEGNLKEEVNQMEDEKKKLKEEIEKKEEEKVDITEKSQNAMRELMITVESKENEYKSEIDELRQQIHAFNQASSEETSSHAETLNQLQSELSALTDERDHLLKQTDAAMEDAQQIKGQLTETSEQLAESYSQVEILSREKDSLASEISVLTEELTKIQDEKDKLKLDVSDLKGLLQTAEDEAQRILGEKRSAEVTLEEVHGKVEELERQLEGYQSQTEFSTKVLEESLTESQAALELLKAEKAEVDGKLEALSSEKGEVVEKLQSSENERLSLEKTLAEMKEATESSSELESNLKEERQQHASMVESLKEEISALQFQLSSQHIQMHDSMQTSGAEGDTPATLRARISDQEIIIEQLESEVSSLQRAVECDVGGYSEQIKKLHLDVEKNQEESSKLKTNLKKVETELSEERLRRSRSEADFEALRVTYDKDVGKCKEEIEILHSDNKQLKRKLVKLIRDKDNLWQQTDKLVDEKKRKAGERWQDNSQVTHCPVCRTEFSLFTRKHHCRLCGKIYCWSCSDNWIDVPHSSKKARVCKVCFEQEQDDGAPQQSMSMIDNESDGDEDDESEISENSRTSSRDGSAARDLPRGAAVGASSYNETDEGKIRQRAAPSVPTSTPPTPNLLSSAFNAVVSAVGMGGTRDAVNSGAVDEEVDEALFQVISQEDVQKSMTEYNSLPHSTDIPPDMASSMVLSAEDLESGEVNKQNEVWIKPGKKFAVPVDIEEGDTELHWEFTSQPKDIVFSVNFRASESVAVSEAEEIVAPCKCDSHRQTVRGELVAKKKGIYSLLFDNTYSRMTSKKVHYYLEYKKKT